MATRKLAFLTPLYFDDASCIGGGERYPHNLAVGLATHSAGEFEVDLISYGPEPLIRPICPGVTLKVLRAARKPRVSLDVVSWDLPEAIAGADLVHIHMAYTRSNEVGMLAAKIQRKPVVVTDHGGHSSWLGASLGILELADQITCYSDFGKSFYQTKTPITVVKGGVNGDQFTPPAVRPERDRVLYVGRLLPHKGIENLIKALPADLKLTVCGRPYHPDYFEMLKSLAIGKDVEFVTDADDARILELYRRAWENVLPSVYRDCYGTSHVAPELMGFTLLEAMACGTPAICANTAAMPEFVEHGVTGFVFNTVEELHGQLSMLASNPRLVEQMGVAARRSIDTDFDLKVVSRTMATIYRNLIDRREEAAA